jgi:histidine triad (HIT) family protein
MTTRHADASGLGPVTGTSCVFCRIVAREVPSYVIAESDTLIAFVSKENHPLIVPKQHLPDIVALSDELAAAIMIMARDMAVATKRALRADGIYFTQTNGEAAGQDVFHYHMHIYPKWSDGRPPARDDAARQQTSEAIRRFLPTR